MVFHSPYPDAAIPEVPLSDYVFANVSQWANEPAFIDGSTGRALTFGQVYDAARKVASSLVQRGMRKGDVFAILSPNVPEYAVAFHGVAMAGGVITTANPLCTADELTAQLTHASARFLLTMPAFLDKANEAAANSGVQEVFVLGEADGVTPFAALLNGDGAPPAIAINPREDLVVLPYSSGTTGRPKGVMLTHYNAVAAFEQLESFRLYGADDKLLGVLPFFHMFGMQMLMNYALRKGATCVTAPRFDLQECLQLIQEYRITQLFLVPSIILALVKHPLVDKYDLSSIRHIGSGAAPLGAAVREAASVRLNTRVGQGYGMTELGFVAIPPPDPAQVRPGSTGVLMPNMEARIVDIASGADLGPNEHGELLVRGPNIMHGYLNDPIATRMTIEPDGWMHTGDVAYLDDEGYVFLVDRLKDVMKCKGYQVCPAGLEDVLLEHPAIGDAAVLGVFDEDAGEVPKAFVVLKGSATTQEIMAYVAGKVAPHEKIRKLEIVDAIPRSPAGKLLRRVLKERDTATDQAEE